MVGDREQGVAKGAGALAIQSVLSAALGAFLLAFMARTLTQSDLGLFAGVFLLVGVMVHVGSLGLDFAIARYVPFLGASNGQGSARTSVSKIIVLTSISAASISLISFVLIDLLNQIFFDLEMGADILLIALFLVFTGIVGQVSLGFLQSIKKFYYLSLTRFIAQILRTGVTIIMITGGLGVLGPLGGWLGFYTLIALFAAPYIVKLYKTKPEEERNDPIISYRAILAFSLPMMIAYSFASILNAIDQVILLDFFGATALSSYFVALSIAAFIPTILGVPLTMTLVPKLSGVYGSVDRGNIANIVKISTRYASLMFIPATFLLAALSPIAMAIIGGPLYSDSTMLLTIIAVGLASYGFSMIFMSSLIAAGHTKSISYSLIIVSLIEVMVSIVLIGLLGSIGAAIARTIMYTSMVVLLFYNAKKYLKVSIERGVLIKSYGASAIMGLLTYSVALFTGFQILYSPLYVVVAMITFTILMGLLGELYLDDMKFFAGMVPYGTKVLTMTEKTIRKSSSLLIVSRKLVKSRH